MQENHEAGLPEGLALAHEDRQIRAMERDVLQALTSDLSFQDLGNYICRRIEDISPGVRVSVCLISGNRMRPWAAPSFHDEYGAFFQDMEIGEGVASCGTAAYRGEPVMVDDIATDPLWAPYRQVMLPHGYRACWTYPVKRRDGSVAATFAFYFRQGVRPQEKLQRIAEAGVHMCVLAIEREENRQQIARLVLFDALTGLPNQANLLRHLDAQMQGAGADGEGFSLLVVDLDRFRDINETLGHAAGDQTLVVTANRLHRHLHGGEFLARMHGDQFVVVARCDEIRASWLAGMLQRCLQEPMAIGGHTLNLGASIGISHYPEGGRDRDSLLAAATSAMQSAKDKGGGTFELRVPRINPAARDRLLLGAALKRAIAEGRLSLHYQPQVYTGSERIHGLEALARWHDGEFGAVPPGRFIGLAEEVGQIESLSRWALREACRQLARWRAEGLQVPAVSVNLSPLNFQEDDLPAYVASLLHDYGLPGRCLTIEITEGSMMALTPGMLQAVDAIRALGVGLAVDDFGTGYSSLSNLVQLPVTEVKIDRSFVGKSLEDERLRALVSAVIGLGRNLGLTVVAEGVEAPAQHELLRHYQCPVLQGYLFSGPLPPEALRQWLAQRHRAGAAGEPGQA
ncbi:EAL domain-containing protein [Orrella sp. JC864]|uniref:EAL domain-containing protein n=1 Tax=Orrella sp. JC864 TaxID=3120298 RepID=UPI00300A2C1E